MNVKGNGHQAVWLQEGVSINCENKYTLFQKGLRERMMKNENQDY